MAPIVLPSITESLGSGRADAILKGSGLSVPSGIDAIISYNSLAMNNRSWLDGIIINKIDGLSDASIRDERENNPQDHGETAFDSFYGGRPLVLNGFIRAFTLDKLRDIEQALKTAFLPLVESPLLIQGRTLAASAQIWCKKNAEMTWSEEQVRDDMFVRNFMIPLRASNPRFVSLGDELRSEEFGLIDTFTSDSIKANDYIFVEGSQADMKVEGGSLRATSTAQKSFSRQIEEVFHPNPSVQFDYVPKGSLVSSVTGFFLKRKDANNHIGITVNAAGTITLQKVEEGVPTNWTMTYTKGSGTVSSRTLGNTYRIKAEMHGSKILFYHGTTTEWTTIGSFTMEFADASVWGTGLYSRAYMIARPGSTEWTYDNLAFGVGAMEDEQVMTLVNNGIFESEPEYQLIGPILNPRIHNAATGEELVFKSGTEIAAGDIWTIDIKESTIIDLEGNSKFGRLDPVSDWPQIAGGQNHVRLSGEGMSPHVSEAGNFIPRLVVIYKHAWM